MDLLPVQTMDCSFQGQLSYFDLHQEIPQGTLSTSLIVKNNNELIIKKVLPFQDLLGLPLGVATQPCHTWAESCQSVAP